MFVDFDPPNRLAYRSTDGNDRMIVTVTFESVDNGTRVVMVQSNIPDQIVQGGVPLVEIVRAGWTASMSKLDRFLVGKDAA